MKAVLLPAMICAWSATLVLAHTGVQNPAVLARMDSMKAMGEATKVLGEMAKGVTGFDAAAARAAMGRLAAEAARTEALFEAPEQDPKSEALPKIWDSWDDFLARSAALEQTATRLQTGLDDLDAVRAGLGEIGTACKACHSEYRE